MAHLKKVILAICALFLGCISLVSCQSQKAQKVVVAYVSVDQVYAEPILKSFEQKTGIKVLAVYDVEATKTSGMVNRLIAEKGRPQADVFWNGEFAQTILLKEQGVLAAYQSPAAANIPAQYADSNGFWTAFGGRARVFLVNKRLVEESDYPKSIFEFLDNSWPADKIAISSPIFGTSATQAAALYALWGAEKARSFYLQLKLRRVRVVDGNSVVKDLVVSGQLMWGLVDSDDACVALQASKDVVAVFPDQDSIGTLIFPATVALIRGAPHPDEARALIDFLLNPDVEKKLIQAGLWQMALRPQNIQSPCFPNIKVKGMDVDLGRVMRNIAVAREELKRIFVR